MRSPFARLSVLFALLLVTCSLGGPAGPARAVAPVPPLPLSIAIAVEDGHPVVDDSWATDQTAMANLVYNPHGISFRLVERRVGDAPAVVRTRADRDALAARTRRGVVNVFVVGYLGDAADPEDAIGGRHWRARGRQYVIVNRQCWRDTMAHELGHYLGHRGHSDVIGNVMSYLRVLPVSQVTEAQAELMRRTARRYLRSGEVRASAGS